MLIWRNRPVRGVLFDMDGVIADTREAHMQAWGEFATEEGRVLDLEEWMRISFGRGNDEILAEFFPDIPPDKEFYRVKGERKEELFLKIFRSGKVPPVPGLHAFIQKLSEAQVRMAVGSSAPRGNVETVLGTLQITNHFETVVALQDAKRAKPDPEIFLLCCERMALDPADCVVLEDSLHGIEAARAAGCRCIGVSTLHPREQLVPLCDFVVADFHEIITEFFHHPAQV